MYVTEAKLTEGRGRRRHSAEFKARLIAECRQPGMSVARTARDNGVNANLLHRWKREVMALVVTGLLNKQVGGELNISEVTVKAHRSSLMRKMKAGSLADLVRMAGKLSEISPVRESRNVSSPPNN